MRKYDESTAPVSDLFRREYTIKVVDEWDDYIDWEKRREAENGFFQKLLRQHGARDVLDIACGTGYHTITLAEDGFELTGTDGSANMVIKARENAEAHGVSDVAFRVVDWSSLTDVFDEESFDAVLCLGNSFTHLFDEPNRTKALRGIHRLLRSGGIALIDQRNYDAMLDQGSEGKHAGYYQGDSVNVERVDLSENSLRFRFEYEDGSVSHITTCPIRQQYLTGLLEDAGFGGMRRFGDFEADYSFYEPDFIIHVAEKTAR